MKINLENEEANRVAARMLVTNINHMEQEVQYRINKLRLACDHIAKNILDPSDGCHPDNHVSKTTPINDHIKKLIEAAEAVLRRDEKNTCLHEETTRLGSIWIKCTMCGMKWADDEGGMPEQKDPEEWIHLRKAIDDIRNII